MKQSLTIRELPQQFGQCRYVMQKGEPYFIAKDVCDLLGLTNSRKAVKDMDDDEKGVTIGYTPGGPQEMATINESGLYHLIFQSRKPEAKAFRKWVTSEVLPSIRKNGYYIAPGAKVSPAELRRMEAKLNQFLCEYVSGKDIVRLGRKYGMRPRAVKYVMNGWDKNSALLEDLQSCAKANYAARASQPKPGSYDNIVAFFKDIEKL